VIKFEIDQLIRNSARDMTLSLAHLLIKPCV